MGKRKVLNIILACAGGVMLIVGIVNFIVGILSLQIMSAISNLVFVLVNVILIIRVLQLAGEVGDGNKDNLDKDKAKKMKDVFIGNDNDDNGDANS